jgi:uncharacterized repeat protein (TIGR02543 family)
MQAYVKTFVVIFCLSFCSVPGFANCPTMDFTGDCRVDFKDFAEFASQWLDAGIFTLNVKSFGVLGVSISSSTGHDGITNYTQTLTSGTSVSLTAPATAVGDAPFTGWTGDVNSSNQTISFVIVDANKTVTANYDPILPDMVSIPGGTFQMGDSKGDGYSDEIPVHTVTVSSFDISKYEITNSQYCQYLNSAMSQGLIKIASSTVYENVSGTSYPYYDCNPTGYGQISYHSDTNSFSVKTKNGRDMSNDALINVSWYGAAAYCNWRSQQEGREQCYNPLSWVCNFSKRGYRLPTEAEWEYAARGGLSGNRFAWGDTISHSQANYYSMWVEGHPYSPYDVSPTEGYHPTWMDGIMPFTSPVGSFAANGYGLFDTIGNASEWCNDWWDAMYYSSSPVNNPTGPSGGELRVTRGGNWYYRAFLCRISYRNESGSPSHTWSYYGIRIVLKR